MISKDAIFDPESHTAVILAGGASTRFGLQPKALTEWRGQRFIEHLIAALRPQVAHIAINSSFNDALTSLALPLLPDPFPDRRGPLAGILAGLSFSSTEFTLFVPCDTPLISAQLAQRLYSALLADKTDIAYAQTGADHHYLFTLIRTSLRDQLRNYFARGDYAVHRWYATQAHSVVVFDDEPEYFLNINTPEALEDFKRSH